MLLSLTGIASLTLTPGDHAEPASGLNCVFQGRDELVDVLIDFGHGIDLEPLLNVALVVPLGMALVLATRRPALPLAIVLVLPGLVELVQVFVPGRFCSLADYVLNVLGGLIGVSLGIVVARVGERIAAGR